MNKKHAIFFTPIYTNLSHKDKLKHMYTMSSVKRTMREMILLVIFLHEVKSGIDGVLYDSDETI